LRKERATIKLFCYKFLILPSRGGVLLYFKNDIQVGGVQNSNIFSLTREYIITKKVACMKEAVWDPRGLGCREGLELKR